MNVPGHPGSWRRLLGCSWGSQQCEESTAGEAQWSPCVEATVPDDCDVGSSMYDADAERCAIDSGACAQDFWDLDRDGDDQETLGQNCAELARVAPADLGGGWF